MSYRAVAITIWAASALLSGCGPSVSELPVEAPLAETPFPATLFDAPISAPLGDSPPEIVWPELAVVTQSPVGEAPGAHLIQVHFNQPMVDMTDLETQQQTHVLQIEPALPGRHRWIDPRTLVYEVESPPKRATRYKVTVLEGTASAVDHTLGSDHTFEFVTERPRVISCRTAGNNNALALTPRWTIQTNHPIRRADFEKALEVTVAGAPHPIEILPNAKPGPSTQFQVEVTRPLPKDTPVVVTVKAGLVGTYGDVSTKARFTWSSRTYAPLKARMACTNNCSWHSLAVHFNNVLDPKSLQHFRVSPLAGQKPNISGAALYASGAWKPGDVVTVDLGPGIRDVFGQKLTNPGRHKVQMAHLQPSVQIHRQHGVLERFGHREIPVDFTTIRKVAWRATRLSVDQVVPYLAAPYNGSAFRGGATPSVELEDWRTGAIPDRQSRKTMPLDKMLGGADKGGVIVGQVDAPMIGNTHAQFMFQVTDLGLSAHYDDGTILFWVTSLSKGTSAKGVDVTLRTKDNAVVWQGKTDQNGLAVAPGREELGLEPQELYALAHRGEDLSYLTLAGHGAISLTMSNYRRGTAYAKRALLGKIYPERPLHKPGDTVHLRGTLRVDDYKATLPLDVSRYDGVKVEFGDPRGQKIGEPRMVPLSAFGTFNLDFEVPEGATLGSYTAVATLQGVGDLKNSSIAGQFTVKAFRAPEFEVSVSTDKPALLAGEASEIQIEGRYLFGAPMRSGTVQWQIHNSPFDGRPDAQDEAGRTLIRGFNFGNPAWRHPQVQAGSGKLDDKGVLAVKLPASDGARGMVVSATVTDLNRQVVSASAVLRQYPSEALAGLRLPNPWIEAGKEGLVEALLVDVEARPVLDKALTVTIERQEVSQPTKDKPSRVSTVIVKKCALRSKDAAQSCRFVPTLAGTYTARVDAADDAGRKTSAASSFYVFGGAKSADRPRALEMWLDKGLYQSGDRLRLLVRSPWPGAHGLLTMDRGGIIAHKPVRLTSGVDLVEVMLPKDAEPGVTLTLAVARGRSKETVGPHGWDSGRPAVDIRRVRVPIDASKHRLKVSVTPSKREARPGEPIEIEVKVVDAKGRPVRAEVSVAAVDQGIYVLSGGGLPDLMSIFWAPRRALSGITEMVSQVVSRTRTGRLQFAANEKEAEGEEDDEKAVREADSFVKDMNKKPYGNKLSVDGDLDSQGPRDEVGDVGSTKAAAMTPRTGVTGPGQSPAAEPQARTDLRPLAHWSPALKTDGNGIARVKYTLPDNLTSWRIVAVAVDAEKAFGAGDARMDVAKPLLLRPSLPRFANPSDRFDATVVVQNETGTAQRVTVAATIESDKDRRGLRFAKAPETGRRERAITLDAGAAAELAFDVLAGRPGAGKIRFSVTTDGFSDAVEAEIPVIRPISSEAVAVYGDTLGAQAWPMSPPDAVHEDVGGLTVGVSSTAMVGLQEGLSYLIHYPHGCLEQTISRAMPLVAMGDLVEAFGFDTGSEHTIPEMVAFAVRKIERMQRSDGGFGYWPGSARSHDYGSIYAMHFLMASKTRGHAVDQRILDAGLHRLAQLAAQTQDPLRMATAAHAVWILASAGRGSAQIDRLFAARDALPIFAHAYLLMAAHAMGRDDLARPLLQELTNRAVQTPGEAHFSDNRAGDFGMLWHSEVRTDALALMALLEVSPEHPLVPKVARWLLKGRDRGRWRNTQENAYALLALDRYFRAREKEIPNFVAKVWFGEKMLLDTAFKGRSTKSQTFEISMADLLEAKRERGLLTVAKEGPGRLYYMLRLAYAPISRELDPRSEGFEITRTYQLLDSADQPVPDTDHTLKFPSGRTVRVRLQVKARGPRRYVVIDDPLPAGMEAIDTSMASTDRALGGAAQGFPGANHAEHRDARTVIYVDHMNPGTYTFEYLARTTTRGNFSLPPAKVEDMYAPEIFARTASATFYVD